MGAVGIFQLGFFVAAVVSKNAAIPNSLPSLVKFLPTRSAAFPMEFLKNDYGKLQVFVLFWFDMKHFAEQVVERERERLKLEKLFDYKNLLAQSRAWLPVH